MASHAWAGPARVSLLLALALLACQCRQGQGQGPSPPPSPPAPIPLPPAPPGTVQIRTEKELFQALSDSTITEIQALNDIQLLAETWSGEAVVVNRSVVISGVSACLDVRRGRGGRLRTFRGGACTRSKRAAPGAPRNACVYVLRPA